MFDTSEKVILAIKDFCEDNDYEYRTDYSGRGMYGKLCLGIVSSASPLYIIMKLTEHLKYVGVSCVEYYLGVPKMDNMGLSTIIYFPKLDTSNSV